jgi:hypothetical protein
MIKFENANFGWNENNNIINEKENIKNDNKDEMKGDINKENNNEFKKDFLKNITFKVKKGELGKK